MGRPEPEVCAALRWLGLAQRASSVQFPSGKEEGEIGTWSIRTAAGFSDGCKHWMVEQGAGGFLCTVT